MCAHKGSMKAFIFSVLSVKKSPSSSALSVKESPSCFKVLPFQDTRKYEILENGNLICPRLDVGLPRLFHRSELWWQTKFVDQSTIIF